MHWRIGVLLGVLWSVALALIWGTVSPPMSSAQAAIAATAVISGFTAPLYVAQPPDGSSRHDFLESHAAYQQ
jgi:hypothetical protein